MGFEKPLSENSPGFDRAKKGRRGEPARLPTDRGPYRSVGVHGSRGQVRAAQLGVAGDPLASWLLGVLTRAPSRKFGKGGCSGKGS